MYICICNAITDGQILEAQEKGYRSFPEIRRHLGIGNCCGRCVKAAKEVIQQNAGVQKYIPKLFMSENLQPA